MSKGNETNVIIKIVLHFKLIHWEKENKEKAFDSFVHRIEFVVFSFHFFKRMNEEEGTKNKTRKRNL